MTPQGGLAAVAALLAAGLLFCGPSGLSHAYQDGGGSGDSSYEEEYEDEYPDESDGDEGGYDEDDGDDPPPDEGDGDEDDDGDPHNDPFDEDAFSGTVEAEEAEILVGHTSVLTGTLTTDGNDVITGFAWYWSCPEKPGVLHAVEYGWALIETDDAGWESVLFFPEPKVGVRTYHFVGTRNSGKEVEGKTSVTILKPNAVRTSRFRPDGSQFPLITQKTIFRFSRNGEDIGVDCPVAAFLQERIWADSLYQRPGWQLVPAYGVNTWNPEPDDNEGMKTLYFNTGPDPSPRLMNVGVNINYLLVAPDQEEGFRNYPTDGLLEGEIPPSALQKVRLFIRTVCGDVEMVYWPKGWRINTFKETDTTVSFRRTNMFVLPTTWFEPPPNP